jgi:hypothetical protein
MIMRDFSGLAIFAISRYLSSSDATTFFGTSNMGGAILVKTK